MSKLLERLISAGLGVIIGVFATLFTKYRSDRLQYANHTENLPNRDYASDGDSLGRSTCTICLNTMPSNHITQLNCGHTFHRRCWEQRLRDLNENNCPNCNR